MSLPVDGSLIILQFDWKENIQRGRGPEEDSSVVHNLQPTAVCLELAFDITQLNISKMPSSTFLF